MGKNESFDVGYNSMNALRLISAIFVLLFLGGCASLQGSLFMKDPLTPEEHNNLGVIYEREGKYDLAIREYKKAISGNRGLITPYVNLGNVYFKQLDLTEAEDSYKKALKIDPTNLEAANNLASLYIETGSNYEKGLEYLLVATGNIDPIPAYALDTLGVLNLRLSNKTEAERYLLQACDSAGTDKALIEEIRSNLWQLGINKRCGD